MKHVSPFYMHFDPMHREKRREKPIPIPGREGKSTNTMEKRQECNDSVRRNRHDLFRMAEKSVEYMVAFVFLPLSSL
jgi:hypothetical protein